MSEIKNKTFEDKCKLLGNKLLIIKDILDSSFMKELEFEFSSLSAVRSISVDKKLLLFSLYHILDDDYISNLKRRLESTIELIAQDYYANFGMTDFGLDNLLDTPTPQDLEGIDTPPKWLDLPVE